MKLFVVEIVFTYLQGQLFE